MSHYPEADLSPEGLPRYLVATPYWGALDAEHFDCVLAMRKMFPQLSRQGYQVRGCAYIDIARATAAAAALKNGYEGLFFIDHDIIFDPRDVVGLMREAERHQTVCYGLYGMRSSGKRMIGAFAEGVTRAECFADGGLYPGQDGGLGFAAIPRVVLEAVGRDMLELQTGFSKVKPLFALRAGFPDWPELFDALAKKGLIGGTDWHRAQVLEAITELAAGWYAGEDISFFHRVRRAGFVPLVDTRPRLGHKGSYKYGLEDVQICVPRAESLTLNLVALDGDPDDPVEQQKLYAAASQFEGLPGQPLPGPVITPKRSAAE